MNVAVLLSGGVDSAVVVHRLKEQGIDPTLFYIRIGMDNDEGDCSAEEDIEMCTYIARKYGLPFEVVSLHREYWDHVMEYALRTVKFGLTPNPDMMCNKMIKFGFFEERWGHAFDKTATGHYATTTERNGKIYLSTARDKKKDQTDFLAQIDSVQVLGNIDYNAFIRRHLGERQGAIVELETGKILGSHKGYWFHTIGQRKGLGLSGGPWYVVAKDVDTNTIFVSNGYGTEKQYGKVLKLAEFHFITDDPWGEMESPVEITFKNRHTPDFTSGLLIKEGKSYSISSKEPVQGIAPGQFAVVYDKERHICVGTGVITL